MNGKSDRPQRLPLAQELARRRWQYRMRQKASEFLRELELILGIKLSQDDILGYEELADLRKAFTDQFAQRSRVSTMLTTPMEAKERIFDWVTELVPVVEDLPVFLFFHLYSVGAETAFIDGAILVPAGPVLREMRTVWEFLGFFTLSTRTAEDGLDVTEDWLHKKLEVDSWGRLALPEA